jgi:hypothetical protein
MVLKTEPGQQPFDSSDVIVCVYKIKLDEMLEDIKDGTAFGPSIAGELSLYSVVVVVVLPLGYILIVVILILLSYSSAEY